MADNSLNEQIIIDMYFRLPTLETMAVNPLFGIVIALVFFLHYSLIAPCRLIIPDDEKAPETL